MITHDEMMMAARLARNLAEPERAAEVTRHHAAIVGALNASQTDGTQDGLAVLDAMAHVLAQQLGGLDAATRRGYLTYVAARADLLAPEYLDAGNAASFILEADA